MDVACPGSLNGKWQSWKWKPACLVWSQLFLLSGVRACFGGKREQWKGNWPTPADISTQPHPLVFLLWFVCFSNKEGKILDKYKTWHLGFNRFLSSRGGRQFLRGGGHNIQLIAVPERGNRGENHQRNNDNFFKLKNMNLRIERILSAHHKRWK